MEFEREDLTKWLQELREGDAVSCSVGARRGAEGRDHQGGRHDGKGRSMTVTNEQLAKRLDRLAELLWEWDLCRKGESPQECLAADSRLLGELVRRSIPANPKKDFDLVFRIAAERLRSGSQSDTGKLRHAFYAGHRAGLALAASQVQDVTTSATAEAVEAFMETLDTKPAPEQ